MKPPSLKENVKINSKVRGTPLDAVGLDIQNATTFRLGGHSFFKNL